MNIKKFCITTTKFLELEAPQKEHPVRAYKQKPAGKEAEEMGSIKVSVDCFEIDQAIEKANRLLELLQEVQKIVNSLSS